MRCAGNADDVLVLGLDLWFHVFSSESNSLLLKNVFLFFFLSFVLSFCKSNDIHKKKLTMTINTDAANRQKTNK